MYFQDAVVLVDGANVHAAAIQSGFSMDWAKFRTFFMSQGARRIVYYTGVFTDDAGVTPMRPLIDFLEYNGYTVVQKPVRVYGTVQDGTQVKKGNLDVEIAVDICKFAATYRHIVLCTGDGDFICAIRYAQDRGVFCTVFSSKSNGTCNDGLVRAADWHVDMDQYKHLISR